MMNRVTKQFVVWSLPLVAGCCEALPQAPGTLCADGPGTCDDALWVVFHARSDGELCGRETLEASERCVGGTLVGTPFYGDGCSVVAHLLEGVLLSGLPERGVETGFGWEVDAAAERVSMRLGPLAFAGDDMWSRDACMGTELEGITRGDYLDEVVLGIHGVPTGIRLNAITADDSEADAAGSLLYHGTIELHADGASWWRPLEYFVWLPEGPDLLHRRRVEELDWSQIHGFRPEERHANYMPDPDAPEHHDRALGERSWRRTPVEVLP